MSWWDEWIPGWGNNRPNPFKDPKLQSKLPSSFINGAQIGGQVGQGSGSNFDVGPIVNAADQAYRNMLKQRQAISQEPQPGSLEYTIKKLIAGMDAGKPKMLSDQEIKARAQSEAGIQYGPQIKAIQAEMARAKTSAGRNQKSLGKIYANLAGSYSGDVKTSAANTKAAKASESAALKELQGSVSGNYSKQMGDQAAEMSKLGISDALPSSTANQKADLQFLSKLNQTGSAAQQQNIDLQGLGDKSYYQQGSGIAKTEGAESITDLTSQLTDYLNQQGSQLGAVKGQQASATSQLMNQLRSGQSDSYGKWDSDRWGRLLQLAQLQESIAKQSGTAKTPTKGMSGALSYLQSALPDSSRSASALNNVLQSQETIDNRRQAKNGDLLKQNPYSMVAQARDYAAKNNLSAEETDALVMSLYTFYGLG